jgi:hypothetical protein
VTPLDIDPIHPAMPISTPASWAGKLAEATGYFYTQGMPEDTKALEEGVFSPQDFVTQAHMAGEEVIHQYGYVLDRFDRGLLFYYTSAHKFRDMYLEGFSSVIPAKAGIHASLKPTPSHPWMPAFAGMTGMRHVRSAIEATRSCPVTYARLYTSAARTRWRI